MHRFAIVLPLATTFAACGAIKDPDPEDQDEAIRVIAGSSEVGLIILEDDDFDHWDEYDDYWRYDEHVRDLPPGFDYDTLDVDDDFDELSVLYRVTVESWVDPGRYEFEVRYEFWPDDSIFRDEFRIDVEVKVKARWDSHED